MTLEKKLSALHQPDRRKFLVQSSTALLTASLTPLAYASKSATPDPNTDKKQLAFIHLHTNETLQCCYWHNNNYIPEELSKINHLLRDHRTNEVTTIEPQLIDLLHQLHTLTNSKAPFEIISGYRSPRTNESLRKNSSGVAKRSYHMQGKAIDIRLADVDLKRLRDTAISLQAGGVGYYRKSGFIHIDTGRPRNW